MGMEEDEEQLLSEYFLPLLLEKWILSDFIYGLLSLVMLEHRVIVFSESLTLLSSFGFIVVDLMKPFVYQAVLLPILPPSLVEILEAPVPFLVGVHTSTFMRLEVQKGVVCVNLDSGKILDHEGCCSLRFF